MQAHFYWLIAGFLLIIFELITGTFYLLIIGIAALISGLLAYFGMGTTTQFIVASIVMLVGLWAVRQWHKKQETSPSSQSLDLGQSVTLDSWISENDKMARVSYRGSLWDAKIVDDQASMNTKLFFIHKMEGNTLYISQEKPHQT